LKRSPEGGEIYAKGFCVLRPEAHFTAEHNYLSPFAGANPTVLVAEDSEDTRYVLSLELRHRGCRVITAADGREAVETALDAHPDLILMDLNLPQLDGLAATEQIRAHSELDSVPIIAVTAFDTYGIREAALEAGCQDYLLKPLGPGALERALRAALPWFIFEQSGAHDTSSGGE
jgi:CheY-like chemotaxis protein